MNRVHAFMIATLLVAAVPASAQLPVPPPTINTTFSFDLPFALAVTHPCQAGVVALNGTIHVAVTTVASSDFKMSISASSTGEARDAGANGLPLANGSLPYAYSAGTEASARFANGKPLFFGHSLPIEGEMVRSDTDAFTLSVDLDFEYNNGVPTTPKVRTIDVSCR